MTKEYGDTGCPTATKFLGYQSKCLECPLPKCVLDEPDKHITAAKKRKLERTKEILQGRKEGKSVREISVEMGITRDTIYQRIREDALLRG
jgi:DNA-binding NarL/FixJ family response regulator|tara:strand:+ start:357 stop:629 length:273 start_codon:yes stop_codon:yes gene_type:complete